MQGKLKSQSLQTQSQKANSSSSNLSQGTKGNQLSKGEKESSQVSINAHQLISSQQNSGQQLQGLAQSKVKKVLAFTMNQNMNIAGIIQSPQHSSQSNSNQLAKKQEVSPNTKKTAALNTQTNRYETLQNKLKNKRRQGGGNSQSIGMSSQIVAGSNTSIVGGNATTQAAYNKQSQQLQEQKLHVAQKQNQNASGTALVSQRKHLKLSIGDHHSDSSFNNITIKSADKNNSAVRTIPLSTKNGLNNSASKENGNSQLTPQCNTLNSNSNSLCSSQFSANSRFTATRPKNPTEHSSSVSSKNSDNQSCSSKGGVPVLDLKKIQMQKFIKQQAQQIVKEHRNQQQNLVQTQPEGISQEEGEGLQNFNTIESLPQQTAKLYQSLNQKLNDKNTNGSEQSKNNNSQSITQIGAQNKSKFTLVSKPVEGGGQGANKDKGKKSFQFQAQSSALAPSGGNAAQQDSFRKNSLLGNQGQNVNKQGGVAVVQNAPGFFSPKQGAVSNIQLKQSQQQQQLQQQQAKLVLSSQKVAVNKGLQERQQDDSQTTTTTTGVPSSNNQAQSSQSQIQKLLQEQFMLKQIPSLQKQKDSDQHFYQNEFAKSVQDQQVQEKGNSYYGQAGAKHQKASTMPNPTIQQQQLISTNSSKTSTINEQLLKQQFYKKQSPKIEEAIIEENQEESAATTKRESYAKQQQQNDSYQSTNQIHQTLNNKQQLNIIWPNKNENSGKNDQNTIKHQKGRMEEANSSKNQMDETPKVIDNTTNQASPPIQIKEEQKTAAASSSLQALKEQLKAQIQKQHIFSNPQSSSQIEVEEIQYPISAGKALKLFLNNLTDFEKSEILEYKEIYFLGLNAQKVKGSSLFPHNYGYDDERGDYNVVLRDHLAYRYEVLEFLGKGSFGQALKCYDYKTNQFVAIKIIRNKKRFHYQAGVELRILMYLKENDPEDVNNIIRMKDYSVFRKHLIISFELLSINLYEFIKNNNFQGVSLGLIRRFAIQILQALKYQKDHHVVHCDLKPENILLKQPNKSGIKIIDYGSSCFQNERIYTYIQSRFYRAPEIILGIPYSTAIDMWSFGCILAELYTGFPLFPGENEMEQLAYIMEIKGIPSDQILEISSRKKLFFDNSNDPIIVANSRGKKRRPLTKTLKGVLRCNEQSFLNFVDQCLDWDPINRMTPLEALQHEWILEGLPPKVLLHHQRMFGMPDDKSTVRDSTYRAIQGFPQNANNNTLQTIAQTQQQQPQQQKGPIYTQGSATSSNQPQDQSKNLKGQLDNNTNNNTESAVVATEEEDKNAIVLQKKYKNIKATKKYSFEGGDPNELNQQLTQNYEDIRGNQLSSGGQQVSNFAVTQSFGATKGQKKNKTIQLFMSELFEEKSTNEENNNSKNNNSKNVINQEKQRQECAQEQIQKIDPTSFYGMMNEGGTGMIQQKKNKSIALQKLIKEGGDCSNQVESTVVDEDIEEGVHFSQTQKIPISLIKQQEKWDSGSLQQQFSTNQLPSRPDPKLNNYLSSNSNSNLQQTNTNLNVNMPVNKKQSTHGSFHKSSNGSGVGLEIPVPNHSQQHKYNKQSSELNYMKQTQQQASTNKGGQYEGKQQLQNTFKFMAQQQQKKESQQTHLSSQQPHSQVQFQVTPNNKQ